MSRPPVVTICGSMRFFDAMLGIASKLTSSGEIVLAPFPVVQPENQSTAAEVQLDELHFRKIWMSDSIAVVTRDGYIGTSTNREIEYAESRGKTIRYFPAEAYGL